MSHGKASPKNYEEAINKSQAHNKASNYEEAINKSQAHNKAPEHSKENIEAQEALAFSFD